MGAGARPHGPHAGKGQGVSTIRRNEAGEIVIALDAKTEADVLRLERSPDRSFNGMVRTARLDPKRDFIGCNLSGLSLAGADLRGFDFSGADLCGTDLRLATIDATSRFAEALIDPVDAAALEPQAPPTTPPPEFNLDKVYEMILAGQAPPKDWVPFITELDFDSEQYAWLGSTVPLAGLTALTSLNLSHTHITDANPLTSLIELKNLSLWGTWIRHLTPLSNLKSLNRLDLSFTNINYLDSLRDLKKLEHLDLWKTRVFDISPLSKLNCLRSLNIKATSITSLAPLRKLKNLDSIIVESEQRAKALAKTLHPSFQITKVTSSADAWAIRPLPLSPPARP
jgi:uncharacterized protein YjbI with pentapeptide repeats